MSQPQPKAKKCRIPIQQLQVRFRAADLNGDGTLSADQITTLLQNLGYEDTYKGTIRKICRNLNKKKKLESDTKEQSNPPKNQARQPEEERVLSSRVSEQSQPIKKNETEQEKRIRKQLKQKKQEDQAVIGFEEFAKYFQILQKPIGKILYKASLDHSVKVAQLCKQINFKNMFHKDKGQKLNLKILVGQQKPQYNSCLQIKLSKQPKKAATSQGLFKIQISIVTVSQQKANYLVNGLKQIYQMVIEMITAEDQQFSNISQVVKLDGYTQGKIAKLIITTMDEDLRQLIRQVLHTADEILQTDLTFFMKIMYQFSFSLAQIKSNKNAVLEDIFAKECCVKFQYSGSQFLDALKEVFIYSNNLQIALSKNVFELLKYEKDPMLIILMGFLSMEKGDILLKFKNLSREEGSRQLTNELIAQLAIVNEFQTENFSFYKVSEIVDGPININAEFQNIKLDIKIDIQDLLKLPYMVQEGMGHGGDSDDD